MVSQHCEFCVAKRATPYEMPVPQRKLTWDRERVDSYVLSAGDEVQIGKFRLAYYPAVAVS